MTTESTDEGRPKTTKDEATRNDSQPRRFPRSMSDSGPTVSVVVLSYERPALLREALRSLAAQSYAPREIIVVDNRSTVSDEVARVAAEFPSVRLIRNRENVGYAAGMNRGIAEAACEYVYLTEDDITLDRDCIRRLVEQ